MKFKLNAGRPASYSRGGASSRVTEEEDDSEITRIRPWSPNMDKDILLKCGCFIPWPVVTLMGSGGQVHCEQHGWQHVTKQETDRARKVTQCHADTSQTQSTLDDLPPF